MTAIFGHNAMERRQDKRDGVTSCEFCVTVPLFDSFMRRIMPGGTNRLESDEEE